MLVFYLYKKNLTVIFNTGVGFMSEIEYTLIYSLPQ